MAKAKLGGKELNTTAMLTNFITEVLPFRQTNSTTVVAPEDITSTATPDERWFILRFCVGNTAAC